MSQNVIPFDREDPEVFVRLLPVFAARRDRRAAVEAHQRAWKREKLLRRISGRVRRAGVCGGGCDDLGGGDVTDMNQDPLTVEPQSIARPRASMMPCRSLSRRRKWAFCPKSAWMYGLQELDRFDFRSMCSTLTRAMTDAGYRVVENPYINFCGHYYDKVMGLRLEAEKQLIAECRAHLTAYDDFLYGLHVNQALHEEQERSYQQRVTQLKASYEAAVNQLLSIAEKRGLAAELMGDLKMIGGAS